MRLETNTSYIPSVRLIYPLSLPVMSVRPDDRVMAVQETYGMNKAGTGDHRYQILFMPMGDTISAFWTDLGPASNFKMKVDDSEYQVPPYFQLVLMEHTVAECQHMAESGRHDEFAVQLLHTQVNESDIFDKYQRVIEEDRYIVKNRSTFGVGGKTQRAGYSGITARLRHERLNAGW